MAQANNPYGDRHACEQIIDLQAKNNEESYLSKRRSWFYRTQPYGRIFSTFKIENLLSILKKYAGTLTQQLGTIRNLEDCRKAT